MTWHPAARHCSVAVLLRSMLMAVMMLVLLEVQVLGLLGSR
jgi:hypothetical protein